MTVELQTEKNQQNDVKLLTRRYQLKYLELEIPNKLRDYNKTCDFRNRKN